MFERNVYDRYGLYCESRFFAGSLEGFWAQGKSYILLPKKELVTSEKDMIMFIDYLNSIGDPTVLKPITTVEGRTSAQIDGHQVYVCRLPDSASYDIQIENEEDLGAHLAMIHSYGKQMPMELQDQREEFFGRWNELWETRLEQLESWYEQVHYQKPQTYVDEAFLFSFPYYMGLTENAIQYVVDTTIDIPETEADHPTICHRKFTDRTWLAISEEGKIAKRPTEFVYDHPSRDLAEWIRDCRLHGSSEDIQRFLSAYEQIEPLSIYAKQLMYARLVFPLHYFEAIEQYYSSQVAGMREEAGEAFLSLLKEERENEWFLNWVTEELLKARGMDMHLPAIDWL